MSAFFEKALVDIKNMEGLIDELKCKIIEKAHELDELIDISEARRNNIIYAATQLKSKDDTIKSLCIEISELKELLRMHNADVAIEDKNKSSSEEV